MKMNYEKGFFHKKPIYDMRIFGDYACGDDFYAQ